MTTKTIDDLGPQAYIQYEESRQYRDSQLLSQASTVGQRMATPLQEPRMASGQELLFNLDVQEPLWSDITPPKDYLAQQGHLFTYQLAPGFGSQDALELQMKRIADAQQAEKDKFTTASWETDQEHQKINKDALILTQMLQTIQSLTTMIAQIHAERYRYNKG